MTPMTPMTTAAPTTPLGYAESPSSAALPSHVRAWPLVVPNLMALGLLIIPVASEYVVRPPFRYAAEWIRTRHYPDSATTWDAMVTAPFLLAIPLALWTVRLSARPRPRPIERIIAWSMTIVSLAMTLLCIGYCVWLGVGRFRLALIVSIVVLILSATEMMMLPMRRAWPGALLAMTLTWASNASLVACVLLSYSELSGGIAACFLTAAAQLIVGAVCVRRWRMITPR